MLDSTLALIKNHVLPLILALIALFAPAKDLFVATSLLIVADLILGVLAARKKGEKITSAGIRRSASKLLIYNIAIGSSFLVEKHMMGDAIALSKIAATILGITELKSVLEKFDIIHGSPLMGDLIKKLGSINDTIFKDKK